jgi:hypothetical protein
VLSLSYRRTQSDEPFSKAELYKNVGKKCPECPVIDISKILVNQTEISKKLQCPQNVLADFYKKNSIVYAANAI